MLHELGNSGRTVLDKLVSISEKRCHALAFLMNVYYAEADPLISVFAEASLVEIAAASMNDFAATEAFIWQQTNC